MAWYSACWNTRYIAMLHNQGPFVYTLLFASCIIALLQSWKSDIGIWLAVTKEKTRNHQSNSSQTKVAELLRPFTWRWFTFWVDEDDLYLGYVNMQYSTCWNTRYIAMLHNQWRFVYWTLFPTSSLHVSCSYTCFSLWMDSIGLILVELWLAGPFGKTASCNFSKIYKSGTTSPILARQRLPSSLDHSHDDGSHFE